MNDNPKNSARDLRKEPSERSHNTNPRSQSQHLSKVPTISAWTGFNNYKYSRSTPLSSLTTQSKTKLNIVKEGQCILKAVCLPIGLAEQMNNIKLLNKYDDAAVSDMIVKLWENDKQRKKIIETLGFNLSFHSGQAFPSAVISKIQEHSILTAQLFRMNIIWSNIKVSHSFITYQTASKKKWSIVNTENNWNNNQNKTVN